MKYINTIKGDAIHQWPSSNSEAWRGLEIILQVRWPLLYL